MLSPHAKRKKREKKETGLLDHDLKYPNSRPCCYLHHGEWLMIEEGGQPLRLKLMMMIWKKKKEKKSLGSVSVLCHFKAKCLQLMKFHYNF